MAEAFVAPAAGAAASTAIDEGEPFGMGFADFLVADCHIVVARDAHEVDVGEDFGGVHVAVEEDFRKPALGRRVAMHPDRADRHFPQAERGAVLLLPRLDVEARELRQKLARLAWPVPARVEAFAQEGVNGKERAARRVAPEDDPARRGFHREHVVNRTGVVRNEADDVRLRRGGGFHNRELRPRDLFKRR